MGQLRDEIRQIMSAPPGSDLAKARKSVGWTLLLFGLIGLPVLILTIALIASAIAGAT